MKIRRKTIILFAVLAILVAGVALKDELNYKFFTYSYGRCQDQLIDDCVKMVNKINSDSKIVDLSLIEYYQLKVFIELPAYDQRAQIFDEQRVGDFISLPISMDNDSMRDKAEESIIDKVSEKWCKRPSLIR